MGVDLGQSRDFSAIAVVEKVEKVGARDPATMVFARETELQLRYLERVPLGTPYPKVVERVASVAQSQPLAGQCLMVVDGTGVGRPVVDLLREADTGCRIRAVIVTGGGVERREGGYDRVPKRDLIMALRLSLEQGKLRIAAGLRHGEDLLAEMAAIQVRVSASGNEQFGAWREGTHDDLVFAVALAVWGTRLRTVGGQEWHGGSLWFG